MLSELPISFVVSFTDPIDFLRRNLTILLHEMYEGEENGFSFNEEFLFGLISLVADSMNLAKKEGSQTQDFVSQLISVGIDQVVAIRLYRDTFSLMCEAIAYAIPTNYADQFFSKGKINMVTIRDARVTFALPR